MKGSVNGGGLRGDFNTKGSLLKLGQGLGHQRWGMRSLSRELGRTSCKDWLRQVEDRPQGGGLAEETAQRSLSRKVFAKHGLDFNPNSSNSRCLCREYKLHKGMQVGPTRLRAQTLIACFTLDSGAWYKRRHRDIILEEIYSLRAQNHFTQSLVANLGAQFNFSCLYLSIIRPTVSTEGWLQPRADMFEKIRIDICF